MRVIVDTSVWSECLRSPRLQPSQQGLLLEQLLSGRGRVYLVGVVILELLQGIKDPKLVTTLYNRLEPFPLLESSREDYLSAAELSNVCRARGIQVSTIDALIAELAIRHQCLLLTKDRDFQYIAQHSHLKLLEY